MRTIQTTIVLDEQRWATIQLPAQVTLGSHRVRIVLEMVNGNCECPLSSSRGTVRGRFGEEGVQAWDSQSTTA
jgi:hypothetical protein